MHIAKFYENRDFIIPQLYFQKAAQLEDKASTAYMQESNNYFYLKAFELFQHIFSSKDYLGYFLINTGFFREGAQILDEKRNTLLNVSSTFQHNDRTEIQFAKYAAKIAKAMMCYGDFEGAIAEYEKAKKIYMVIVNNEISGKAKREYYNVCKFLAYCYTKKGEKTQSESLYKSLEQLNSQYSVKKNIFEGHPLETIVASFEQKAEKARKKEYFGMEAEYRYAIIRLLILMSDDIEQQQKDEHLCRIGESIYKYVIAVARRGCGNEIYVSWFRSIFSFEELYNTANEILLSESRAIDLLFNATFLYARALEQKDGNSMIANLLNINVYNIFENYFEVPEPYADVMNKVKEIYEDVE